MLRFPSCVVRVVPFLFALAIAPVVLPSGAQATAMFEGEATLTLTLTGIENLTAPGGTLDVEILAGVSDTDPFGGPPFPYIYTEGTGTDLGSKITASPLLLSPPDFDDPTALGIDDDSLPDSLSITAFGKGTADAAGYVDVIAAAFGLVTIDNYSLTDVVAVSFLLSFSVSAEAAVDDPLIEDAIGGAGVDVFSLGGDVDVTEFVEADGLFGPFDPAYSDLIGFTLVIGADSFDDIEIYVDAGGFAEAIPAPGGLAFLLAGLLLIRFRRS